MQSQALNEHPSQKSQETALWNRIKSQFTSKPRQDKEQSAALRRQQGAPLIYVANAADSPEMQQTNVRGLRSKNHHDEAYLSPNHLPSYAANSPRLSKSDQMLNRVLQDQLQLAYSDYQNNLRCAQSPAALEHLRHSQPRLEITPTSSRQSSPNRPSGSPHNLSPSVSRRSHSPSMRMLSDAGSSGSESSYSTGMSVPPPSYYQMGRSKSCNTSRTPSPNQHLRGGHAKASHSISLTNSPARHTPIKTGLPPQHPHMANGASELVKQAHINLLWAFILDAVKSAELDHFSDCEPKQWWRRLFQVLKQMHGKAKASSIAGQLMGNPMVLEAIQNKLAGMAGGQSGYVQSLPKSVQRRIKALKKLQFECTKIEAEFYQEIHSLECKFASRYSPIFTKRKEIITGEYEPNDEECEWPSDSEDEDDEDTDKGQKQAKIEPPPIEEELTQTKGIASFWSTTFKNVDMLSAMIQEHDEPILENLKDIKIDFSSDPMGFTLNFEFDENEYFSDKALTKHYEMRSAPDENDPFGFEGPEIVSCKGCTIQWKDGKNVTITNMKKKQKNAKTGITRTVTKAVQNDSFFNFFSPPEVDMENEDDIDEDTEALLQADFQIGHFIRERIVPHAILYFTGEAEEDDDDDDEEDEDDEDYDEEDDPDYDPSKDPSAAQAKDCKQQ